MTTRHSPLFFLSTSAFVEVFGCRDAGLSTRFSAAGRHSPWKGSSCRRPKTCTNPDVADTSRAKKSRPKAALQFKPDARGSRGHQCWL
jgi:hypothetical protein